MARLTTLHVLAIVFAVAYDDKLRLPRKERLATSVHDDLMSLLETPGLCPDIIRLRPGGFDLTDAATREACAEARSIITEIGPVVLALQNARERRRLMRQRRA